MSQYRYTLSNMTFSDSDDLSDSTYEYESKDSEVEEDSEEEEESEDSEYEDELQEELEEELLELIRDLGCYYRTVQ